MKLYSFDAGQLTSLANQIKDQIEYVSKIDLSGYVVSIGERGFLGKIKAAMFPNNKDDDMVIVVTMTRKGL